MKVESGWLPLLKGIYDPNLEEEADEIQKLALTINEQYKELCDWLNSLKPNDIINQLKIDSMIRNKSLYIANLFHAKDKKDPLKYAQDEIIEMIKHVTILDLGSILDTINASDEQKQPADTVHLYPNQEKFYTALESWTSSLANPYCRKWIVRYLKNGRKLPFYRIRVFKYIKKH